MFTTIKDKIYFKGIKVASFDPFIRESLKMEIEEVFNQIVMPKEFDAVIKENEVLIDRVARLEAELMLNSPSDIVGATWKV